MVYEKKIAKVIKKAKEQETIMDSYTYLGEEFAKALKGKNKEDAIKTATEWYNNPAFVEYINELRTELFAKHGKEGLGGCTGCGGCT